MDKLAYVVGASGDRRLLTFRPVTLRPRLSPGLLFSEGLLLPPFYAIPQVVSMGLEYFALFREITVYLRQFARHHAIRPRNAPRGFRHQE